MLVDAMQEKWNKEKWRGEWKADLDPNAELLMVIDSFSEGKGINDRGPQAKLTREIVRHLGNSIPSIVLQTGMTKRVTLDEADGASSSLDEALKSTQTGSSVIFLDVRERLTPR